jgi:hypothetical protein
MVRLSSPTVPSFSESCLHGGLFGFERLPISDEPPLPDLHDCQSVLPPQALFFALSSKPKALFAPLEET